MWGLNTGRRLQERHEENLFPLTSIGDYSSIPKQSISQVDYNNNNGHTVHIAVVVYISFLRRSFLQSHHPTHALKHTGDHFPRMPYSTHSTSTISYLPLRYEYPTHKRSASRQAPRDAQELIPGHTPGNQVRRACFFCFFQYARIWTQSPDRALNLDLRSSHLWSVRVILTYLFQDLDQDSRSGFSQKIQSPRTNYKKILSLTILIFLAFDLEFICFTSESTTQVDTISLKSKSKSCRVSFS